MASSRSSCLGKRCLDLLTSDLDSIRTKSGQCLFSSFKTIGWSLRSQTPSSKTSLFGQRIRHPLVTRSLLWSCPSFFSYLEDHQLKRVVFPLRQFRSPYAKHLGPKLCSATFQSPHLFPRVFKIAPTTAAPQRPRLRGMSQVYDWSRSHSRIFPSDFFPFEKRS